jgi:hypothetical protein
VETIGALEDRYGDWHLDRKTEAYLERKEPTPEEMKV